MGNFTKYKIEVRLKIGLLKIYIDNPEPPRGTCKNCRELIYWLKLLSKKNKIQISHIKDNQYIAHSMVCPTVLAYEERIRVKSLRKKSNKKNHANPQKNNTN